MQPYLLTDFTAGELGSKLSGRLDLAIYRKGVKELHDFVPFSQGGVTTRPGLQYIGATKSGAARLIPFDIGYGEHFVLEFGADYIRPWNGTARVQRYGADVEVTTTYTITEVWKLQVQQVANQLYLACDTHPIAVLDYTNLNWSLADLTITNAEGIPAWLTAHVYALDQLVLNANKVYQCIAAGTSGGTSIAAHTWHSICWSPALVLYCAVAETGEVATSPDGNTWTAQAAASAQHWQSICWSPGLNLFCAVASDGAVGVQVMTSPNGVAWTSRTSASAQAWQSVCWSAALTLFVAVANDGAVGVQVMTSANGTAWASHTSAEANEWQSVCWSHELTLFVAVSYTGVHRVMTSANGTAWATQTAAEANPWYSVCWSAALTLFVAVAVTGTHRVMTSSNGTAWTPQTAAEANIWQSVCWSPELAIFVAVSFDGTHRVMTSPNGTAWYAQTAAGADSWYSVCWSPALGLFAAVATSGTQRAMVSDNGIAWGYAAGPTTESANYTDGTVHWKYIYQKPFSRLGDYPAAISHFNGCMYYAGTVSEPQKAWRSAPFEYGNFNYSDAIVYTDTQLKDAATWGDPQVPETENITETQIVYGEGNAFYFEIASKQNEAIQWMVGADALVIGTNTGQYVAPDDISALNIRCKRRSGFCSVAIQPDVFQDAPIFIEGGEGAALLREYAYLAQSAELQSPDLTFAADHMLVDGAVQMDFSQIPHPVMNVVTKTGQISALLYNKPYGVVAWHRLSTLPGLFTSVAVVAGTSEDLTYVIVNRGGVYTIERFGALWGTTDKCLDSWAQYTVAAGTEAGLTRMASQTASIYNVTDAAWFTAAVSAGGVLTYPTSCGVGDVVIIGLPYTPHGQTMPIPTQMQVGPGIGGLKTIVNVVMRVLDSMPFKVSGDGTHWDIAQRADGVAWTAVYTGDVLVPVPGDWNREGCLYWKQDLPQRTTILAMMPELSA